MSSHQSHIDFLADQMGELEGWIITYGTNSFQKTAALVLWVTFTGMIATAFLRGSYSDSEVAGRSDTIVVGRIKSGSIKFIYHPSQKVNEEYYGHPDISVTCGSWVHQVELIIDETLKGQVSSSSIVVKICHGLDPLIGGRGSNQFRQIDVRCGATNFPKDFTAIYDTGNSCASYAPVTGDIRSNHIWFLRYFVYPGCGESNALTVFDPEDIKPIDLKENTLLIIKGSKTNQTFNGVKRDDR